MNRELIDEVIENLKSAVKEGDSDSLPEIITTVYEYELISDEDLCKILSIDFNELDEILAGDYELIPDKLNELKLLIRYLNKAKNQYEKFYFSDKK